MSESPIESETIQTPLPPAQLSDLWKLEDWWAVWLGGVLLILGCALAWSARPADFADRVTAVKDTSIDSGKREGERKALIGELSKPFKRWEPKLKSWTSNPREALVGIDTKTNSAYDVWPSIGMVFLTLLVVFGFAAWVMEERYIFFAPAFGVVFLLAIAAQVLATQEVIKNYGLEYPLWGLLIGLCVTHTIGTPKFLLPAVRTEFYIKTGLVLLGAEVLLNQLLELGLPGICISWIVTPIVLIGTYLFGQYVLKIESKTLNMVVAADMSVCGVSAAIATAAACRAKKEELSLAIGISLAFTVVMMVAMPKFIEAVGIDPLVGAAWIGGTIDATGAVAAAGEMLGRSEPDTLGKAALKMATTVKMIQNILIGVIAFAVSVYWVTFVDRTPNSPRVSPWEIWYRLPKFILGFVAASILFSWLHGSVPGGDLLAESVTRGFTKYLREWMFCIAFVSIGLETNFPELMKSLKGGKAVTLYVLGQAFSLILSLAMCWLMLKVVFPDVIQKLSAGS